MRCYFCKKEIAEAIRVFVKAQNNREKDSFRDLCTTCYKEYKPGAKILAKEVVEPKNQED